jgi:hypothetical protein
LQTQESTLQVLELQSLLPTGLKLKISVLWKKAKGNSIMAGPQRDAEQTSIEDACAYLLLKRKQFLISKLLMVSCIAHSVYTSQHEEEFHQESSSRHFSL